MKYIGFITGIISITLTLAACNDGGDKKNDPATVVPETETPAAEEPAADPVVTADPTAAPATDPSAEEIAKSTILSPITGSLALTTSGASLNLLQSAPSAIRCVDAVDGTVYNDNVPIDSDGDFSCDNVPKCYNATDCAEANPVQVSIIDVANGNTLCIANAGKSGLECDVAGCLSAAIAEAATADVGLEEAQQACLSKNVNLSAAAAAFQQSLSKAYKMGEIALDTYTFEECIAMTPAEKIAALDTLTRGSLAKTVIAAVDNAMKKEMKACLGAQPLTAQEIIRDFLSIDFQINLYNDTGSTSYDDEKGTAGTLAYALEQAKAEALAIQVAIKDGEDPQSLVDDGTIGQQALDLQYVINCGYFGDGEEGGQPNALNAAGDGFADCPATMTRYDTTMDYVGRTLASSISFPDINDPTGIRDNEGGDSGGPGFPYNGLKKIAANPNIKLSLQDIYQIFFTEDQGLKFRMNVGLWDNDANTDRNYVIDADGAAHEVGEDRSVFLDNTYAPSFTQVFGQFVNKTHPYDLTKLMSLKVHRNYNPTGQEFFHVAGKSVNDKVEPISCDITNSDGKPAGIGFSSGVTVSCAATGNNADIKRYFVDQAGNEAFLRLINKDNGFDVRSASGTPIFFQDLNVSLGGDMPTCTAANQVNIFKYETQSDHDSWLDGQSLKTICVDFDDLRNPSEYYMPYREETTIGSNTWTNHVLAGLNNDGEVKALCLGNGAITIGSEVGCLNYSDGTFTDRCSDDTDVGSCSCESGESAREYNTFTAPGDGTVALEECTSSSTYYLEQRWEPGAKNATSDLLVALISSSTGDMLNVRNTAFDPTILAGYVDDAFEACQDSPWCWRREDIKNLTSASEIPDEEEWMKRELVHFYCHDNFGDATIRGNCAKLNESTQLTIAVSKFSNAAATASETNFKMYEENSYFSHLQQPNPGYNRVFDFETFEFRYANFDPFCDDVDASGKCGFESDDIFLSGVWRFDPDFALYSPNDISGFVYDADKDLFPAEPTDWNTDWWNSYMDPVWSDIGGPAALTCTNDRSIRISWDDIHFYEDLNWRTPQEDVCGSGGYFAVRNIVKNKNTYLIDEPDRLQSLVRIAYGTLNGRAVPATEKRFDFIQALAAFMMAIDFPPILIDSDGNYIPVVPTINGKVHDDSWTGFQPYAWDGQLGSLIDLFIAKGSAD